MKTLKNSLIVLCAILLFNCDNDDANNPNNNACTFAGLTYVDTNGNIVQQYTDTSMITDFFPNALGQGVGQIEIGESGAQAMTNFVTNIVTQNASGPGTITLNGNTYNNATVTCQRAGTNVGDEFRFDVVIPNVGEAEFCVTIDSVSP
ncbi:hypothetical protein ACFQ1Q_01665 [Winogradskyella litorisediminis]|uniref:Lipoprotein n=1 Tax=Winogradskyella litorisediminis TaxID=1156618 RepID=A0ABW3N2K7_9FLAO